MNLPETVRGALPGIVVDDNFFGVSAVSAEGRESIVTFGGLPPAQ